MPVWHWLILLRRITVIVSLHCVFLIREPAQCPSVSGQQSHHSQQSTKSLSPSFLAAPPTPLPSLSSSEPPDCLSPFPPTLSPCPPPLSPDSKRRLKELSHDLSLKQKISLALIWALAAFYGLTACFPEKVRRHGRRDGSSQQIQLLLLSRPRLYYLLFSSDIWTGINRGQSCAKCVFCLPDRGDCLYDEKWNQ